MTNVVEIFNEDFEQIDQILITIVNSRKSLIHHKSHCELHSKGLNNSLLIHQKCVYISKFSC